jgi:3-oxoacyl-[acyl-carrier protein] reductase
MTTPAAFDLTGRVALVTGAGALDGIGTSIARLLGALGAAVAVTSTTNRCRDRAGQLTAAGIKAFAWPANLTEPSQVDALVEQTIATLGPIDILVNNAGMVSVTNEGSGGSLDEVSYDVWRAEMTRNLDTQFLVTKAVIGGMTERGWGRVINMSSVTGPVMAMRGEVTYAASKAGVVGFTRAVALDVAGTGVTVNAVAPGWIATGSQRPDEAVNGQVTPVGRSGTADEIASAVAWLASPGAAFTTGQCIVVDGGNSIAEERA